LVVFTDTIQRVSDFSRRHVLAGGIALGIGALMGQSTVARATSSTGAPSAKWRDLGRLLPGRLVRPDAPSYAALATPRNLRFAAMMPQAVALCRDADDIATAISWARRTQTPFAIRGGGHNYADASSSRGLIISTRRMTKISVDDRKLQAQAGVLNSDVARVLPQAGTGTLMLPGGTCPNVGIAGLTLGGGIGPNAPWAGLTADHLRQATMVTATGDVVVASGRRNSDLFWALRGAAGGNFGVVTDMTYDLVEIPVPRATTFLLEYQVGGTNDLATATALAWQQIRRTNAELVGGTWTMSASTGGVRARVRAQVLLPEDQARDFMAPLLSLPSARQEIVERSWWETYEWYRTPISPPSSFWDRSLFVEQDLDSIAVERLAGVMQRFPAMLADSGSVSSYGWVGGRVSDPAPQSSAYVHRAATALLVMSAGWSSPDSSKTSPAPVPAGIRDWMQELWETAYPSSNGQSYQNFPDPELANPLAAYYGVNLQRLTQVKRAWDPQDVFTYAQGIPLRA
jgi:hypothetical protein